MLIATEMTLLNRPRAKPADTAIDCPKARLEATTCYLLYLYIVPIMGLPTSLVGDRPGLPRSFLESEEFDESGYCATVEPPDITGVFPSGVAREAWPL